MRLPWLRLPPRTATATAAAAFATALALAVLLPGCGDDDDTPARDGGNPGDPDAGPVVDVPFGLASRPANATCRAPARPVVVATGDYDLRPLFPNLVTGSHGGHAPIVLRRVRLPTQAPDPAAPGKVLPGPYQWIVGLRSGRVSIITDPTAAALPAVNLREPDTTSDISQSEGGFLGLAFDPDIGTDPTRAFVYFTRTNYQSNENYLWLYRARLQLSGTTYSLVETTPIFRAFTTSHHHGGEVLFGPDGFLYVSVGEGDLGAGAQDPRELRGKLLRFDVHSTALTPHYGVPASNPYARTGTTANPACSDTSASTRHAAACPEVYAVGFRNPFRFSFDRQGGALWVGDVGSQNEEIDLVELGKNYGWNTHEGPGASSNPAITPAVSEIPRMGCTGYGYAIIGGFVYRGPVASLQGKYITADNDAGKLYVLESPYAPTRTLRRIYNETCSDSSFHPASFAEDEDGKLYVVSLDIRPGRGILALEPRTMEMPPPGGNGPAPTLSATGCFDAATHTPAPGLIPYEVNAELWSDGASKRRWMALPDGGKISVGPAPGADWDFPNGTVLVKEFAMAGRLIETRLLVRHDDGDWAGYAYAWNSAGTEAYLLEDSAEVALPDGPAWHIPGRSECLGCHTSSKGRSLGLETRQLARSAVYPGGRRANQLDTLSHIGLLETPIAGAGAPAFVPPYGPGDTTQRARAYLHANCSHCHPGPGAKPELAYDLTDLHVCNEAPSAPVPGGTALVVPGDPAHSILALRMRDTGMYRMPKLGSRRLDLAGITLIESWISSGACP